MYSSNLQYTLTYKKIKNINLRIDHAGNVKVSAPVGTSKKIIDNFVLSKQEWIKQKQNQKKLPLDGFVFFLGKQTQHYPNKEEIAELLLNRFSHCKQITKLEANVEIKNMRGKYGYYSTKSNTVFLNPKIVMADEDCIDYVIIHELCHKVHKNHQSEFNNLVSSFVPNYKELKKLLFSYPIN